jgi:hypothetical protein
MKASISSNSDLWLLPCLLYRNTTAYYHTKSVSRPLLNNRNLDWLYQYSGYIESCHFLIQADFVLINYCKLHKSAKHEITSHCHPTELDASSDVLRQLRGKRTWLAVKTFFSLI